MRKNSILALCAAALMLGGCNLKGGTTVPKGKTELKIYYFKGGYGEKFLQDMKSAYENYNKSAFISLYPYTSATAGSVASAIEGGTIKYDLYFLNQTGMNLAAGGYLENLDDVYNSKALQSNLTVAQKMNHYYQEYFDMTNVSQIQGSYYAMPWSTGYCGLLYNETALDEIFKNDTYTLPRTTNELVSLSDRIVNKGAYPFVWSTETEYWTFMFTIWWAQYEGYDNFKNYFSGHYIDEQGQKQVALNAENLKQKGREESFKLLAKFMQKKNNYSHTYCDTMSFAQAQAAFFGRGYGQIDSKLCAFMVNGDWADSEMKESAGKYNQQIKFMRSPVISALGTKLGITEAQLQETVSYVDALLDGQTATKPTFTSTKGLSVDEVVAAVKEARCMVYDLGRHHNIVFPKNSRRSQAVTDIAKDFLRFFASDFASKIYVEALEGLNLPYNYQVQNTSRFSTFVKSMYTAMPDPIPVSYYKTTGLTFAGNVYITPGYKLETFIFPSTMDSDALGTKLYEDTIKRYTVERDWHEILEISGLI